MKSLLLGLGLLFIGLKLTDNIDWSWWLVLMPLIVETFRRVTKQIFLDSLGRGEEWAIKLALYLR